MTELPPDPVGILLSSVDSLHRKGCGTFTIIYVLISLMIDAKLLQRQQVLQRLQLFYDALSEERRNNEEGRILKSMVEVVEKSPSDFQKRVSLELIEGGLLRDVPERD